MEQYKRMLEASAKRKAKIAEWLEKGLTPSEIARLLKISRQRVYQLRRGK